MNNIEQFAKDANLDSNSLTSLVSFLTSRITASPESVAAFTANPELCIQQGVSAWQVASRKFFENLIDNTSDEAKCIREQLAEETYYTIRSQLTA